MGKPSLRDKILDAGLKVMFRRGYIGSGVRDVMAEASAPLGSFTNHFRSKELFARDVLDRYFDHVRRLVAQALDDQSLSPRERLRRYLDIITERLAADGFTRGCLIGDFSLEAAPQSDVP
jgi:TetR/AcrR family transcriptional repressor of nem operon